ncbi:hypothetical protein ACET3Z_030709 [Daucus carota]
MVIVSNLAKSRKETGIDVPIYSLKRHRPTVWDQSVAGSSIWVVANSKSSLEHSDYSDYEEDNSEGLGFLESSILQRGIQTETVVFAKWENHTPDIASKMMASMDYTEGMGLGATNQGIVSPISVRKLPSRQSLGYAPDMFNFGS